MDIKNCVEFSITKDDRVYTFHIPGNGNLGEAYDAAYQVLSEIAQRIQEIAQKAAPKSADQSSDAA